VISQIRMNGVASFKSPQVITTDKKINLIYGINGTGKSTISNFLYAQSNPKYSSCEISPTAQIGIVVYNHTFVREIFYESDGFPGIFSLSKENKAAEERIGAANRRLAELNVELTARQAELGRSQEKLAVARRTAAEQTWQIKTEYTGGDRVLAYCLTGYMGDKEKLYTQLSGVPKPAMEPTRTIADIKKQVEALADGSAPPAKELPALTFSSHAAESDPILQKPIEGKKNSTVAALIERLHNSDWVATGLKYLPEHVIESGDSCPFCQGKTITPSLVKQLEDYFDASYRAELAEVDALRTQYNAAMTSFPEVHTYTSSPFAAESAPVLEERHRQCIKLLEENIRVLQAKVASPSSTCSLKDSGPSIAVFNTEVAKINERIGKHNRNLARRSQTLSQLKDEFWTLMRWKYDQTITRCVTDHALANAEIVAVRKDIASINKQILDEQKKVLEAQRETVNIDEAIQNINSGLLELGIDDFRIKRHSDSLYRLERTNASSSEFESLSEGEKMLISFLYFCELCLGRASATDISTNRIAIIDDPISSLSHMHVFSIGQLIKRQFFWSNRFEQVFVLTHSLYFFYELTDPKHDRRENEQKLFRITKNPAGSKIAELKYEEIKNDYQSYWDVVRDPQQSPALIANCMRNIIEFFFDLVKRKDLNNVFQMEELRATRHQAFCRFVNRESHSFAQNVFDLKEFDYEAFCEGLRLVFEKTGYGDHYHQMIKGQ
jgi:wobble nucleotide-excising tRNase